MKRGERLKERRKELNLTLRESAELLGISPAGVQNLEREDVMPNLALGLKISEVYRKSILWVLDGTDDGCNRIPILGTTQAGPDKYWSDNTCPDNYADEYINLPTNGRKIYGLKVVGDSMLGMYSEGDIVLVDSEAKPIVGEDVIIKTADEVMVKRLSRIDGDKVYLDSYNTAYGRILRNLADIKLINPVIGSVKSFMIVSC